MGRPGMSGVGGAGVVVLGDGRWSAESLRRIRASGHSVLAAVVRQSPSDGTLGDAAAEARIPVLQPTRVNDPSFVEALRARAPDLLVSVAYDQILRAPVRGVARLGGVNLHAGALPRYRGRNVINWAIINGEAEIGVTAHLIDDGIDTGDVVLQRFLPIGWTDTYGDVLARVVEAIPPMAADAVDLITAGGLVARPQDHAAATYCGGRAAGDEWIDWTLPSRRLHDLVRGIARPGPGARTLLGQEPVTIWRAYFDPDWPRYLGTPGQVVGRDASGVTVKTGDSTLRVLEVQCAGAAPAVPGWPIGTRLGLDTGRALCAVLERLGALATPKA